MTLTRIVGVIFELMEQMTKVGLLLFFDYSAKKHNCY